MTGLMHQRFVRRRFSGAAGSYGPASDIQASVAAALVKGLELRPGMSVLDVGAGDGVLTHALIAAGARVTAVDTAWGMARAGSLRCPQAAWVQADACALPLADGHFDLVVSSSAYQWVDDLQGAFRQARRVLMPGGCFAAALFGRRTLNEFFESLRCAAQATGRVLPDLRRLPSEEEVSVALKASGLEHALVRVEQRRVDFRDVKQILAWLKAIGANGAAPGFFWGKRLMAAMEKEYRARFSCGGRVYAGFEIIRIEART